MDNGRGKRAMSGVINKKGLKHKVKTFFELHGISIESIKANAFLSISSDLSNQGIDFEVKTLRKLILKRYNKLASKIKFGLFIGRFNPFHMGHQNIVNEIILSGRKPIIMIGSINDDRDLDKNPLSFDERKQMIEIIYPNNEVIIIGNKDQNSWDLWFSGVMKQLKTVTPNPIDNVSLFFHNKEVDRTSFYFDEKQYTNQFYTELFKVKGFDMIGIEFVNRKDFKIDANGRDIRHNIEGFKHFLDGRIYHWLKHKNWK